MNHITTQESLTISYITLDNIILEYKSPLYDNFIDFSDIEFNIISTSNSELNEYLDLKNRKFKLENTNFTLLYNGNNYSFYPKYFNIEFGASKQSIKCSYNSFTEDKLNRLISHLNKKIVYGSEFSYVELMINNNLKTCVKIVDKFNRFFCNLELPFLVVENLEILKDKLFHVIDEAILAIDFSTEINGKRYPYFISDPHRCIRYFNGTESILSSNYENIILKNITDIWNRMQTKSAKK